MKTLLCQRSSKLTRVEEMEKKSSSSPVRLSRFLNVDATLLRNVGSERLCCDLRVHFDKAVQQGWMNIFSKSFTRVLKLISCDYLIIFIFPMKKFEVASGYWFYSFYFNSHGKVGVKGYKLFSFLQPNCCLWRSNKILYVFSWPFLINRLFDMNKSRELLVVLYQCFPH